MQEANLNSLFLGAYGENNELFERILLEFVRDHVFWRRNFHPEDSPPISTEAQYSSEYLRQTARMKQELHRLSARLKQSVPFFHPRYIGHMSSDLLLPGLIAQLVTTLYNPNNITHEAAPVTVELELEVGLQLAKMLGFPAAEDDEDGAFGHLTCGGTTANYEGLWLARTVKCWPLALKAALKKVGLAFEWDGRPLSEYSSWELFNISTDAVCALFRSITLLLKNSGDRRLVLDFSDALKQERLEYLGVGEFFHRHGLASPRVFVPTTAHYSWEKAMKLLGLGYAQLEAIPTTGMRMDMRALELALEQARENNIPVLAVVGVVGTTEFGTIDLLNEVVALRERFLEQGLSFWVHVDAAWGGYLASLFRNEDGSLRSYTDVHSEFRYFPSRPVYEAVAAIAEADSVTIDPHKLGYLPFGTGAFICRRRLTMDFVTQEAAYVFDKVEEGKGTDFKAKYSRLGQYILEGSKPGASAAAAYVTHKVLPLDYRNFGRLPARTISNTEYFFERFNTLKQRVQDKVLLLLPFEPDCNLITVAMNPVGNRSLAVANAFSRRVFQHLAVNSNEPLQNRQFFGSYTSLTHAVLGESEASRILSGLKLDEAGFCEDPVDTAQEADHIFVLRHTLMNPWLSSVPEDEGETYIDQYLEHLALLVEREAENLPSNSR